MTEKTPSKSDILNVVQAQFQSTQELSERFVKIENLVEKQDSKNQAIIIAVLVAFVLIVGTVAVEVILSSQKDSSIIASMYEKIDSIDNKSSENYNKLELINMDTKNEVDLLRAKNPYLK